MDLIFDQINSELHGGVTTKKVLKASTPSRHFTDGIRTFYTNLI
jgi:hypothetical protein